MILSRLKKAIQEQNWFAVVLEVFIVVLGVVIGFQITAWGQDRTDATREQSYLQQLSNDLRETERIMDNRDARMAITHQALNQLVLSFSANERPPRDTVITWIHNTRYRATPRPVLATVEALVASGDFGAITDDLLRASVSSYLDLTREYMVDQERQIMRTNGNDETRSIGYFDVLEGNALAFEKPSGSDSLYLQGVSGDERNDALAARTGTVIPALIPTTDWESPFPFDVDAFYQDASSYRRLVLLASDLERLAQNRAIMRESANALGLLVEAELNQ